LSKITNSQNKCKLFYGKISLIKNIYGNIKKVGESGMLWDILFIFTMFNAKCRIEVLLWIKTYLL